MGSAADARLGVAVESTYGTRVAPVRWIAATAEDLGFTYNRYTSPAIGIGMWAQPSVVTSKVGGGSLSGDVMTKDFGYLLQGIHGNTVTPVQVGTSTAYKQTHTLNTPPSRSYSAQVQMPVVSTNTLVPHDMVGIMMAGVTLSWTADGVLSYEFPVVYQDLDLAQSNASYVQPTIAANSLFPYNGLAMTFGGVNEANIIGDGSLTIAYPLRDDAFKPGSNGKIAKPVLTAKPSATLSTQADFEDNAYITRTVQNTTGDLVLTFTGGNIAGANYNTVKVTIPDAVCTASRPTVSGAGPLSQPVEFIAASASGNPPVVEITSTETVV